MIKKIKVILFGNRCKNCGKRYASGTSDAFRVRMFCSKDCEYVASLCR